MPTPFRSAIAAPAFVVSSDPVNAAEPTAGTLSVDTISEATAATGVTVDGLLLKDGRVVWDAMVAATITAPNATGGSTTSAFSLALTRLGGSAVASARQVLVRGTTVQYHPESTLGSVTFGSATVGSIIASGAGWALVKTDATGAFACTATNTVDETLYFSTGAPIGGVSIAADGVSSVVSTVTTTTWSA